MKSITLSHILEQQPSPIIDLDDAYNNQQNMKRTVAVINDIIQTSIKEKKSKTTQALSKISLKINKNSPKTKKIVYKLVKKYCPIESEIRRSTKGHQHLVTNTVTNSNHTASTSSNHTWANHMTTQTHRMWFKNHKHTLANQITP